MLGGAGDLLQLHDDWRARRTPVPPPAETVPGPAVPVSLAVTWSDGTVTSLDLSCGPWVGLAPQDAGVTVG